MARTEFSGKYAELTIIYFDRCKIYNCREIVYIKLLVYYLINWNISDDIFQSQCTGLCACIVSSKGQK